MPLVALEVVQGDRKSSSPQALDGFQQWLVDGDVLQHLQHAALRWKGDGVFAGEKGARQVDEGRFGANDLVQADFHQAVQNDV